MAYTLNTSHPLYPDLIELFGVQSGALVSCKTARTFTPASGSSFGSGTYGEHFNSVAAGYTANGASFAPYLSMNTSVTTSYTVVAVVNASGAVQGGTNSSFLARAAGGDTIRAGGKDSSGNAYGYRITGSSMGTAARMITYCRIGETSAKLYNNTTLDASSTSLGADYNSTDARADYLCGWDGQNSITSSLVWLAVFDRELSAAEISSLYSSLGASNTFGLVSSGGTNASATSGTGTSTGSGSGGTASGGTGGSASASSGTGTSTGSGSGGSAAGLGGGTFASDAMENNTGAGLLISTAVKWTWYQGSIGAAPTSTVNGTGTTDTAGVLSVTGLPSGAGFLLVSTTDGTGVYYQPGTVA